MNQTLHCSISYLIDFIKLMSVSFFVFDLKTKSRYKTVLISAAIFVFVVILSVKVDLSKTTILYSIISTISVSLCLKNKKQIINVIAFVLSINLFDTIFGIIIITFFDLTYEQLSGHSYLSFFINSVTEILVLFIILLKKKNKISVSSITNISLRDIIIFALGLCSVAIYLTSIMMFIMDITHDSYKKISVISLSIGGTVFMIICFILLSTKNKNIYLKKESSMTQSLLLSQEKYYLMLLKREEQTKQFCHDIKNHLLCIRALYNNKEYTELESYFDKLQIELNVLSSAFDTGNKLVNVILNDIQSKHTDVKYEWIGTLDSRIKMENIDICTLFSNILSNAFEAADSSHDKKVCISVKFLGPTLFLQVKNTIENIPVIENGNLLTHKKDKGHGYGSKIVKECIESYNGKLEYSYNDYSFVIDIIIPNVLNE